MTAITDIKQNTAVKEIIGRNGYDTRNNYWRYRSSYSIDQTVTDYAFWDRLRRGEAWGYRLGGLFAQPIAEIVASWALGGGIQAKLADNVKATPRQIDKTNDILARFSDRIQGLLLTAVIDLYCLGDMYIMVQPDGSLAVPSPDTVEVTYDARNYLKPIMVKITTRTQGALIVDTWTDETRHVKVQYYVSDYRHPTGTIEREYDNLLGRIPIVHFANDRGTNEVYGRPIYEALLYLFQRYDDLLTKSLDGAELMGNPIPAFVGMKDVQGTIDTLLTAPNEQFLEDYVPKIGDQRINWDELPGVFLGEGGDFKFVSPGTGYTADIREMLRALELEMIYKVRIPEVVWGKELSSANHTAVEQMKTFYMHIEGRRLMLEGDAADGELDFEPQGGLLAVFDLWLRTQRLMNRADVIVAPCVIRWPELSSIDQNLQFQWTQWLYTNSLMTPVEALAQSQLVENAETEIKAVERLNGGAIPRPVPPTPTTQTAAVPETVTEADSGDSLFMALNLANNPDLIALQKRLKQLYPSTEVTWNPPTDYHITMLYAPSVDETQAKAFAQAAQGIPMPDLKLAVGGLHVFDNVAEHALHFRLKPNPALREYQAQLYAVAQQVGIPLSSYSAPDAWTPHITMGYLPEKTRAVPYEAKFSVVPSGVLLMHGDTALTSSALAPAETTPVQEMTVTPHIIREITSCIEGETTSALPDSVVLYIRHISEAVTDKALIHAAAMRHYQRITAAESIQSTRLDFESGIEALLLDAIAGDVRKQTFITRMMNLIRGYGFQAYRDGLKDGGVNAELDDDDVAQAERLIEEQFQYVRGIADQIYLDDVVTEDEASSNRPTMWFNKSIYGFYLLGIESASSNAAVEWVLGRTEKHCPSCSALDGQVRRMKYWLSTIQPKSGHLACHGFNCDCKLVPTDKPVTRGRLPNWGVLAA